MLAPILLLHLAVSTKTVLPAGKGRTIVQRACSHCHALRVVTSKRASKQQWSTLVDQMISRGADLEDEEIDTVVNYLAKNFTSANGTIKAENAEGSVNVNQATAAELAAVLHLSQEQGQAIVDYRKQNGKFADWRQLTKVPGVRPGDIETNKDRIRF